MTTRDLLVLVDAWLEWKGRMGAGIPVTESVLDAFLASRQPQDDECEEFEPSGLAVAADPDGESDCQGNGWYRCKECARKATP